MNPSSIASELIQNTNCHTECPACRSKGIYPLGKLQPKKQEQFSTIFISQSNLVEIWQCKSCLSMFKQNSLMEFDAVRLYAKGDSGMRWAVGNTDHYSFLKRKTRVFREQLYKALVNSQSILDIGCSDGTFLDGMKAYGLQTAGVEYSRQGRNICSSKGHSIYNTLGDVHGKYDLITAFDLVEHLYDLSGFFKRCRDLLAPRGSLMILTGDPSCTMARIARQSWWYSSFPEHVVFPSALYFSRIEGFRLESWIRVRHSFIGWHELPARFVRAVIRECLSQGFNGLYGMLPDHQLVVLSLKS